MKANTNEAEPTDRRPSRAFDAVRPWTSQDGWSIVPAVSDYALPNVHPNRNENNSKKIQPQSYRRCYITPPRRSALVLLAVASSVWLVKRLCPYDFAASRAELTHREHDQDDVFRRKESNVFEPIIKNGHDSGMARHPGHSSPSERLPVRKVVVEEGRVLMLAHDDTQDIESGIDKRRNFNGNGDAGITRRIQMHDRYDHHEETLDTTLDDWVAQGLQIFPSAMLSRAADTAHHHQSEVAGLDSTSGVKADHVSRVAESRSSSLDNFPPSNCGSCRFFVPGFRKSGSTSMYFWIAAHPRVRGVKMDVPLGKARGETFAFGGEAPQMKNIDRFFSYDPAVNSHVASPRTNTDNAADNDNYDGKGILKSKDNLRTTAGTVYGTNWSSDWISGDASQDILSNYNASRNAQRNIRKVCGVKVKFVVMMRDPVERVKSLAAMRYRRRGKAYTHAHPSLDDEVRANMKEALGGRSLAWARRNKEAAFDMLERYDVRLGLLFKEGFSPSQVLIVFTEDLAEHGAEALAQVYRFLGLEPSEVDIPKVTSVAHNSAHAETKASKVPAVHANPNHAMSETVAAELCELLQLHMHALKRHLGGVAFPWKSCNTS